MTVIYDAKEALDGGAEASDNVWILIKARVTAHRAGHDGSARAISRLDMFLFCQAVIDEI